MDQPILVIGGGIGGLTAAIALRQMGFPTAVYERSPELLEVGAAISIMANATRVLKRFGLLEKLLEHGEILADGVIQPNDGGPLKPPMKIPTDVPGILIHRADLQHTLLSSVSRECLHLGKELVEIKQDSAGVTAIFADGSEARGSLMIASDGLNSSARRLLFNDGPPLYRGYQCWRGVNPDARLDTVAEVLGRGVRMGLIPMGRRGAAWWICANESEHQEDGADVKAKLLGLLHDFHSSNRELISGTPVSAIRKSAIYDRPAARGWSTGRVLLIGDAAHPTTPNLGQGGGMAIEDAALISRCLDHFPDHVTAFRRFEELRFPRVKKIVDQSRTWGVMGQWSNPLACWFRNKLLASLPNSGLVKQLLEVMNYDPFKVDLDH
jgi:2-polyprenyl-6-methoxyphenol hydroxylase-like FAD-dependent oxidoreductase